MNANASIASGCFSFYTSCYRQIYCTVIAADSICHTICPSAADADLPITGTGAAIVAHSTSCYCIDTVDRSDDVTVDSLYAPGYSFAPNSCGFAIADVSAVTTSTTGTACTAFSCDPDIIDSQIKRICRCLKAISFSSPAHATDATVAIAADAVSTIATFSRNSDISRCDCYQCIAAGSLQANRCCTATLVAISTIRLMSCMNKYRTSGTCFSCNRNIIDCCDTAASYSNSDFTVTTSTTISMRSLILRRSSSSPSS